MITTSSKNKKIVNAAAPDKTETEVSNGMDAPIYNSQGKKISGIRLPESVFGVPWNDALMHQVVVSMQANARPSVAHTKGRGEVRGGGRKPWKQKGTGRARHGSIRSPIWKGGGVTHGPLKEKVYARGIPKKMRAKSLFIALSRKFSDGEILFVDTLGLSEPKTAEAKKVLAGLSKVSGFEKLAEKKKNAAIIASSKTSEAARKSFRNMGNILTEDARNLNPVSVLGHKYVIFENPAESIKVLEARLRNS